MNIYNNALKAASSLLQIQGAVLGLSTNKKITPEQTLGMLDSIETTRMSLNEIVESKLTEYSPPTDFVPPMNQEDISILNTVRELLEGSTKVRDWTSQELADSIQTIIDHYGAQ